MKRVTIEDIANQLGVSKGIVSRALTGKYNVSDEMRNEITHTAVAMGYDFDKLRSTNKKRSKCVLVMSSAMLLNEEYWQPIIRAMTTTLDSERINLEYYIYDEQNFGADDVMKLKCMNASGYVFMNNNPEELLSALESTNRTIIVIDPKTIHGGRHLQVKYNNFYSVYELTKLLISKGHKHFLFYGPVGNSASFTEREQGFLTCVKENAELGVTHTEVLFTIKDNTYTNGEKLEQALKQNKDVTAVVCANDLMAMNALYVINKLGKSVPEDYSVVGFDNIKESGEAQANLTTVNVPRQELGREAAKYLIEHISNQQIRYSQIVIDCETIIRNSIRSIKQ